MSAKAIGALVIFLVTTLAQTSPAQAAGSPIRPDYCLVINPGSADVEVMFFPSKLNITAPLSKNDNADHYRIVRNDGRRWVVGRNASKNIHDRDSDGVRHRYRVLTRNAEGRNSRARACTNFDTAASISPGRLRDWQRRGATVAHSGGSGSLGTSARHFSGADGDVVTTEVGPGERTLNPDGGRFAYQASIRLTEAELDALVATSGPSWNVMQRGLASSAGGQWKMSLVMAGSPKEPRAQCSVRDGQGREIIVNATDVLRADRTTTITCVVDDARNRLQIISNGRTDRPRTRADFGTIAPYDAGAGCWRLQARTISVGNKPACNSLSADDRFQGTVNLARVLHG